MYIVYTYNASCTHFHINIRGEKIFRFFLFTCVFVPFTYSIGLVLVPIRTKSVYLFVGNVVGSTNSVMQAQAYLYADKATHVKISDERSDKIQR